MPRPSLRSLDQFDIIIYLSPIYWHLFIYFIIGTNFYGHKINFFGTGQMNFDLYLVIMANWYVWSKVLFVCLGGFLFGYEQG